MRHEPPLGESQMSHNNEHGPVEEIERDHGPEWWAMGAELCMCGHRADGHEEEAIGGGAGGTRFRCTGEYYSDSSVPHPCACLDYDPS